MGKIIKHKVNMKFIASGGVTYATKYRSKKHSDSHHRDKQINVFSDFFWQDQ
jgi:hypothetical protein